MKTNFSHSIKIIVLSLFILLTGRINAQIVSDLTNWTVFNTAGTPPAGWNSALTIGGSWVAPVVGNIVGTQGTFITANIGGGAQGIWRSGSGNSDTVYYRGIFTLSNPCLTDSLRITSDNTFDVWVNGTHVGSGTTWNSVQSIFIPKNILNCGNNLIAVEDIDDLTYYGPSDGWWMACNLFQNAGTSPTLTAGNNGPITCCSTLNLTATLSPSSAATYSWTGPGGFTSTLQNPSISNAQLSAAGVYTVTAIVAPCCTLTTNTTVVVNPTQPCSAQISISGRCDSLCFELITRCGCIRYRGWNFNDPAGSDYGIDCHKFSAPGMYTIEAYFDDNCANISQLVSLDITVVDTCCMHQCDVTPKFQYSGSNPVIFTDISTSGSGTISSWFWDFGDGSTSTLQNPVHGFALAGTYSVCLTVIVQMPNGSTCCDQYCKKIEVRDPTQDCVVIPNFTYSHDAGNSLLLYFTNTSSGYQTVCDLKWNFDDPASGSLNTSTLSNPNHIFTAPGVYHVCLWIKYCVYDASGNVINKCEETICYDVVAGRYHRNRNPRNNTGDLMTPNRPNPFSGETEVSYTLPNNFQTALFIVSDSKGLIVFEKEIKDAKGIVVIDARKFSAGTYNYEMIVNNSLVESKRMVVVK